MTRVIASFTLSLDGFIADAHDDVRRIMRWYFAGDTPVPNASGITFNVSSASAAYVAHAFTRFGAIVTGRRDFDVSRAWGGESPLGAPIFILTHNPPPEWDKPEYPFTFVTSGVDDALAQARAVAGEKDIAISGSQVVRQALNLGLIDELAIDLVPLLLGSGIRLFETLDRPLDLELFNTIAGAGVTHLQYRILKEAAS
jgi:dihydrofolate reductase